MQQYYVAYRTVTVTDAKSGIDLPSSNFARIHSVYFRTITLWGNTKLPNLFLATMKVSCNTSCILVRDCLANFLRFCDQLFPELKLIAYQQSCIDIIVIMWSFVAASFCFGRLTADYFFSLNNMNRFTEISFRIF